MGFFDSETYISTPVTNRQDTLAASDGSNVITGPNATVISQILDDEIAREAFRFAEEAYEEANISLSDMVGLTEEALLQHSIMSERALKTLEDLGEDTLDVSRAMAEDAYIMAENLSGEAFDYSEYLARESFALSRDFLDKSMVMTDLYREWGSKLTDTVGEWAGDVNKSVSEAYETAHEKDINIKNEQIVMILAGTVVLIGVVAFAAMKRGR